MHFKTLSDWMRAPGGGTLDPELLGLQQRVATLELKYVDLKRRKQYDKLYEQYIVAKAVGKTHKRWISRNGKDTRDSHRAVHRSLIPIDDYFIVDGERLFLPGDPRASFAETANCSCTVIFESDTVTLPTVSEMLEYELQRTPKPNRYRRLEFGRAYKEKSVWVVIPDDVKRIRVRLLSLGNSLGAGKILPGLGSKIPKVSGNAADIVFSEGKRRVESIPVDLDIGQPKEIIRSAPGGFGGIRVTVWGRTFAPVDVSIDGSAQAAPLTLTRPRR